MSGYTCVRRVSLLTERMLLTGVGHALAHHLVGDGWKPQQVIVAMVVVLGVVGEVFVVL